MLRPGEKVWDDVRPLMPQRTVTMDGWTYGVHDHNGEARLLARIPNPKQTEEYKRGYSKLYASGNPVIPRSDWSARLKEQTARKRLVSQWQNFAPHDQNGLPTCWANGPSHAFTTLRVMMGLTDPTKPVYISACSLAVPISGGHSGGDEWDAAEYLMKYGGASQDVWPNNSTDRSLNSDSRVVESRKHHVALECFQCDGFDEFASACLLGYCCAIAYNWWSHVIMLCDLVEIESGSWGVRIRNNWGAWGDRNEYGQPGYAVFREGHGTPSSGHFYRSVLASAA